MHKLKCKAAQERLLTNIAQMFFRALNYAIQQLLMIKICVNIIAKTSYISKSSNNLKVMENHSEESEYVFGSSILLKVIME